MGQSNRQGHLKRSLTKREIVLKYFDAELVGMLCVSLVRPHLEYALPVWNPSRKKDIDMLESVQHRATRLVPGLKKESYEVRLKLHLKSSEKGETWLNFIKF